MTQTSYLCEFYRVILLSLPPLTAFSLSLPPLSAYSHHPLSPSLLSLCVLSLGLLSLPSFCLLSLHPSSLSLPLLSHSPTLLSLCLLSYPPLFIPPLSLYLLSYPLSLCLLSHPPVCRNSFSDILRAILLSLEVLIEDPELQINGFILIIDWSDFSFKQASKLTPSILKLAIEGLQVGHSGLFLEQSKAKCRINSDCVYYTLSTLMILLFLPLACWDWFYDLEQQSG